MNNALYYSSITLEKSTKILLHQFYPATDIWGQSKIPVFGFLLPQEWFGVFTLTPNITGTAGAVCRSRHIHSTIYVQDFAGYIAGNRGSDKLNGMCDVFSKTEPPQRDLS